jgi:flagellar hook-associated protein 2
LSDISIPGVTASKYKTDELIEGLMKVERIPRERANTELEEYREQQTAWREVNQHSITLRDTARKLFSYNNPFSEKIAESTNERAVTATATREALDQSFRVSVTQTAAVDSFLSSEIPRDAKVPEGHYVFGVGEGTIEFNWKGGTFTSFVEALNRRGGSLLRASVIQITPETRSLLVESLKTGANNRLSFSDAALTFALENGIIKKNDEAAIAVAPDALQTGATSNGIIDFSRTARARDSLVLEYTVTVTDATETAITEETTDGPDLGKPGSIEFKGITIENLPSETALAESAPQVPPEPVADNSVLALRSVRGVALPLPAVEGDQKQSFRIPLAEYGDVDALLVQNRNTHRTVSVESVKIIDPRVAGDYVPVNPVSVAGDAELRYEGISVTRPTNSIDDLVPGITIELHEPTEKQETISIKPDTETAKNEIISFVAQYNRLLAELNILTQKRPEIITELQYFTDDERARAEEKLGIFFGDTTLNGIKASLQRITSNIYPAPDQSGVTSLTQIGISTKATAGGGVEASRLRGYLEIDEKKLDEVLSSSMPQVKALFGYDTDRDLVVDSGVGHAIDAQITPYVQTGGIFATRTNGLGTRITATERRITQLDQQLERKEADLRNKYGQMEGALRSLEQQSDSINNFNRQNSPK